MFIKIEEVLTQADIQIRVSTDQDMIDDIAESIEKGDSIRPVLVTQLQNGKYIILDGHHRFQALKQAGKTEIEVIVNSRVRSMAEAVAAGVVFNAKNGLRLTREDIKRSIELLLHHDPKITPQEIMRLVKRSKSTVYEIMNELSRAGKIQLPETRTGADGKERPTTYEKNIRCGNPRCKKFVSAVYIEQLENEGREDGDWIQNKTSGKWYCSTDCETEADVILEEAGEKIEPEVKSLSGAKNSDVSEHSEADIPAEEEENAEVEPVRNKEREKEPLFVYPCPICGKSPAYVMKANLHSLACMSSTPFIHHIEVQAMTEDEMVMRWDKSFRDDTKFKKRVYDDVK